MEELKSLVVSARSGDLEAFGEIVRRFQDMAHGYAYSVVNDFHLAEDVAQDAFLDAYQQLPNLRNPEAFTSWFRRIVFKHCDRHTRSKRIQTVSIEVAPQSIAKTQFTEEHEMKEEVLEALQSLPEHERMVTTLFYIDGYSQKEIGEFLEVPVTTVKRRLYNSRQKLKERMLDMVKNTLQENALPDDFAERLLRFPFPKREPKVKITDCPDESFEVRCIDAQTYFVPLAADGKCDWAFYDWPGGRLTGVNEFHVISTARWGQGTLLRVWRRETDIEEWDKPEWQERHLLVENDTYRWVKLESSKPGKARLSRYVWADKEPSEPEPMKLKVGSKWGKSGTEVVGVSEVTIGGHLWKCLKVAGVSQTSKIYAEWYVAETGRTVFFRRYNAAGWRKPERHGSFESLAGNLEVEFQGITFRHWYDCIPDFALEKVFG
ncbi:MAG: sigma-70 family RNA polymerase sigma factor [Chloroflexi bacterium]|nr:sigma-70 family RNA polymerase sigma factor [Chloroflexota bacterium]